MKNNKSGERVITRAQLIGLGIAALMISMQAIAEPFRITHAEPVRFQFGPAASAHKPGSSQRRMSFTAFNRRFDLDLEENATLTADLSSAGLAQVGHFKLLRGRLRDHPESWVRLSIQGNRYSGAIWDGAELYAIDPNDALAPHLDIAPANATSTLIYRLSDTYGGFDRGQCGVHDSVDGKARSSLRDYKAIVQELRQSAAMMGAQEISVAVLADHEFSERYGSGATYEMLTRMNIVDGIFGPQVGVNIVASAFRAFSLSDDPFTTTNPTRLLEQVSAYRSATSEMRGHALTHLLTGKSLDGTVLGVGYIGGLCSADAGAGLSEDRFSAAPTALIMAHEIGHNFGAQHDGETTSVCVTTPQTFLMAPFMAGMSEFSQCSLDTMRASMARASCLTPARTRDVAVSAPTFSFTGMTSLPLDYSVDIRSIGEASAHNIVVTATFGNGIDLTSASLEGGVCRITGQIVNCELPELAAGATSRLQVRISSLMAGTYGSTVTAVSSVEQVTSNNSISIPIDIDPILDATISFSPETISIVSGETFDASATVTATGQHVLEDAQAQLEFSGFTVVAVEGPSGPCLPSATRYTCALGTLEPGASAPVTMRLTAPLARDAYRASIAVARGAEPFNIIHSAPLAIQVLPRVDLEIDPLPNQLLTVIGAPTDVPLTIRSVGAEAMLDARVLINAEARVAVDLLGLNVSCARDRWILQCTLGPLAPGEKIEAVLRVVANEAMTTRLRVEAAGTSGDEIFSNSTRFTTIEVRPHVDVRTAQPSAAFQARDELETTVRLAFASYGVQQATDITAALTLPEGFILRRASVKGGECTTAALVATCTLPTLAPTEVSGVDVTFVAPSPGLFSGSFVVAAAEDADATNNSAPITFEVMPNVDAHIVAPRDSSCVIGALEDWVFSVVNGRYPIVDGSVTIQLTGNLAANTASSSRGSCSVAAQFVECPIGTLQPGERVDVTVRGAGREAGSGYLSAQFHSPADRDFSNNRQDVPLTIYWPSDIYIFDPGQAQSAFTVGSTIWMEFQIYSDELIAEPFVEIDFDPARVSQPTFVGGSACDWSTRPARCSLEPFSSGERNRLVRFQFVPLVVGDTSVAFNVGASNDRQGANDQHTITYTIVNTANPRPPSGTGSGGGGGGGGSMAPAQLLLLGLLLLIRAIVANMRRRASAASF